MAGHRCGAPSPGPRARRPRPGSPPSRRRPRRRWVARRAGRRTGRRAAVGPATRPGGSATPGRCRAPPRAARSARRCTSARGAGREVGTCRSRRGGSTPSRGRPIGPQQLRSRPGPAARGRVAGVRPAQQPGHRAAAPGTPAARPPRWRGCRAESGHGPSSPRSTSAGPAPLRWATPRNRARSCPIAAAARWSCPTTSPITSTGVPPLRERVVPVAADPRPSAAGTYRTAICRSRADGGSVSRLRCSDSESRRDDIVASRSASRSRIRCSACAHWAANADSRSFSSGLNVRGSTQLTVSEPSWRPSATSGSEAQASQPEVAYTSSISGPQASPSARLPR